MAYEKEEKFLFGNLNQTEKNANLILIEKGAIPVDFNGLELTKIIRIVIFRKRYLWFVNQTNSDSLESKIRVVLNDGSLTAKELLTKLNLKWTTQKMNSYLKKLEFIEVLNEKNKNLFKLKEIVGAKQATLFA